ncbi:MAG: type III secretion system inner membrane ring subunit SctD [Burkholderiaceae bacterium]|nr:type III secretion system inner membrane ring subunit SctD [Burkholderiaceae bacterium]
MSNAHSPSSTLEFRVLSGSQVGARVPVASGQLLIGADLSCDIVLSDPWLVRRHAILEVEDGRITLLRESSNDEDGDASDHALADSAGPEILRQGLVFTLGNTRVVVSDPADPWPSEMPMDLAADGGAPAAQAPAEVVEQMASVAMERRPSQVQGARWLAVMMAGAILGGGVVILKQTEALTVDAPRAGAASNVAMAVGSVRRTIQHKGLGDAVEVLQGPEGELLVRGYVSTEAQRHDLLRVIEGMSVRHQVDVHSSEGLCARIDQVMVGMGLQLRCGGVAAGNAGLTPVGEVNQGEIKAAAAAIPRQVHGVRKVALTDQASQEALKFLNAQLNRRQLEGRVRLSIDGATIRAQGMLSPAEAEQWALLRTEFLRRNSRAGALRDEVGRPSQSLPFKIVQLYAGPPSSVVTDSGQRIYEGGQHQGFTLLRAGRKQLVFVGPDARTIDVKW